MESTGRAFFSTCFFCMKTNYKISIIIIGYNTCKQLKSLLFSIACLKMSEHILEVVYIDDGSTDSSFELFNTFNLEFNKNSERFSSNRGRVFATQRGIDLAIGNWYLFIQSNEVFSSNILAEYINTIEHSRAKAYVGVVTYHSLDKLFEKYLNNLNRGVVRFLSGDIIHYKYLLFGNALIHCSVFSALQLNKKLHFYGGEELEFAYRFNKIFPNMIKASPSSVVYRNNHPCLSDHCKRLFEFGQKNFRHLNFQMKLDIVVYGVFLKPFYILKLLISAIYFFCSWLNKYDLKNINFYTIRLQLLSSILRGYYSGS